MVDSGGEEVTLWILSEEKQEHWENEEWETGWICHRVSTYLLSFSDPLLSFNPSPGIRHAPGHPPVVIVVLIMMLSQDAAPVSAPALPPLSRFLLPVFSLCPGMSRCWPVAPLPGYQHFSYWPQYPPGSQELVNSQPGLGLGVINTLGYKMELINRCYYLQRAVQESNEGSLLSQRVGADVNVGYFVEPNKWGTENCL